MGRGAWYVLVDEDIEPRVVECLRTEGVRAAHVADVLGTNTTVRHTEDPPVHVEDIHSTTEERMAVTLVITGPNGCTTVR